MSFVRVDAGLLSTSLGHLFTVLLLLYDITVVSPYCTFMRFRLKYILVIALKLNQIGMSLTSNHVGTSQIELATTFAFGL